MVMFWLCSCVLLVAALVPFLRSQFSRNKKEGQGWSRDSLNTSLYQRQLDELRLASETGLVDEPQELVSELQQRLLQDVPLEAMVAARQQTNPRRLALWITVLVTAGSVGGYALLGAYGRVSEWLAVSERLPELSRKVMAAEQSPNARDLQDFSLALRTRLASFPEDPRGWYLLARLAMAQQQPENAIGALHRAYRQSPGDPQITTSYAQLLARSGDPMLQQQAQVMMERLLAADPDNLQAWSLYAFMAYEQQDYARSLARWQQLLARLDPADERYPMVQRTIGVIREKLDGGIAVKDGPVYRITIALGEQVELPPQGFLFVFAQQVDGAPMPIAAKKLPLTSFPVTLTLSDEDAMLPQLKLSQQSRFVVTARISEDGNVAAASGEWQGRSQVIDASESGQDIAIMINSHL